jgi:predicted nucleic acid-binding protein
VCVKQFISDPLTPKVHQLFDLLAYPGTEFFVPDLFYIETANILWKYVRARLYTIDEVLADLATLKALPLRVVSNADLMEEAVSIGLTYGISAYDGSYVALSRQVSAPVLTLDGKLVTALASAPYDVRSFNDFSLPTMS